MAAVNTVLELLNTGDHVVAMDDLYGGTFRLFNQVRTPSAGLSFDFVDLIDKRFYDGKTITRSDGFVVQTGDSNPADTDNKDTIHAQPRLGFLPLIFFLL